MADYQYLTVEHENGAVTLAVNRPDRLNALNAEIVDELAAALRTLAADNAVGAIIITGTGDKAFVAGADIGELSRMGPLDGVAISRAGQDAFRFIETMGKPVVAAVNGYALGGGLELALACHLRIASENARFGLPEVTLGIIPGYGGTVRLPRLVGRGRALELILTGEMIDATEAHRIGLVNRVVAADQLMDTTHELVARLLGNGPVALRLALEAVEHGLQTSTDDALTLESNLFGLLATTEDMREGMSAFLEKRKANFKGR